MKAKELNATFVMNLQMFADLNTNVTTDAGMTPEMKTFYDKQLIRLAKANLVHDQFAQKRNIPKNGGKTIEFRQFDSLPKATTPLEEGVTPKGKKPSVKAKTAAVEQYGDYVAVSDQLELTSVDPVIVEFTDIMGDQAGRTLDTITRDILAGGTNVLYAGGKTSRADLTMNDKITVKAVKRAATLLKAMNTPKIDGSYVAIIHPYVSGDLMDDPEFIDIHKYADVVALFEGEIGKVGGVRFVESTEAKIIKSAEDNCPTDEGGETLGVFSTLVLGAKAYGTTEVENGGLEMIIKPKGSGEDPLNQRSTIGWKAMKTAERLVEQYMIRIESLSTDSPNVEAN